MTDASASRLRVAVDIGGTFTDVTALDSATGVVHSGKALTTPQQLSQGVMDALDAAAVDLPNVGLLVHGSTVVINALLERKGARTVLVTTSGAGDVYEIGRANRPDSFNLFFRKHRPLIPREHVIEMLERLDSDGEVIIPIKTGEVERVATRVGELGAEAVAVVFLNAYREPRHEMEVKQALNVAHPGAYITASHEITREYREFERTSTTVANAYVGPRVVEYLRDLRGRFRDSGLAGEFLLMQSAGGLYDTDGAEANCIQLLESGPAGGAVGVGALCQQLNIDRAIAFDMGGTTAKACVVVDGKTGLARDYFVGGYFEGLPLRVPVIDIQEIGTGGGSIAWLDEARALKVGPRSAGADPGPACYGRGGTDPTITDAQVVLGRLGEESLMAGRMALDASAARTVIEERIGKPLGLGVERAAAGIIAIANAAMAQAVRSVTLDQGLDPRDFVLVAYGGAGPLHAVEVARELGLSQVVVPPSPGHFSARGMLMADLRRDYARTQFMAVASAEPMTLVHVFEELERAGFAWFERREIPPAAVAVSRSIDMRYVGQEHSVTVPLPPGPITDELIRIVKGDFDVLHDRMFGHSAADEPAQFVTFRSSLAFELEKAPFSAAETRPIERPRQGVGSVRSVQFDTGSDPREAQVIDRHGLEPGRQIEGPAVIQEVATSTLVPPECSVRVGEAGELWISLGQQSGEPV